MLSVRISPETPIILKFIVISLNPSIKFRASTLYFSSSTSFEMQYLQAFQSLTQHNKWSEIALWYQTPEIRYLYMLLFFRRKRNILYRVKRNLHTFFCRSTSKITAFSLTSICAISAQRAFVSALGFTHSVLCRRRTVVETHWVSKRREPGQRSVWNTWNLLK